MFRSTSTVAPWNVIGDRVSPWIGASDTAGSYELFELDGAEGSGPPPHFHPWQEAYVVLEGRVALQIGDDSFVAHPGDVANVPADVVHTFRIASPRARFLVVTDSAAAGRFFADLDANVDTMPDDFPKVLEIAERHSVTAILPTSVD